MSIAQVKFKYSAFSTLMANPTKRKSKKLKSKLADYDSAVSSGLSFLTSDLPKTPLAEEVKESETVEKKDGKVHHHHHHHHHHEELKKKLYQSRRAVFILGALIGLLATIFVTRSQHDNFRQELENLIQFDSSNFFQDDWRGMLPTGLQSMLSEFESKEDPEGEGLRGSTESFSVGKRLKKQFNLTSVHNVVMVPGVISTGIESWGTSETGDCPSIHHFRKRLWGSFYMLRTMILDKTCWLKHIMLDPETGLDPPGIKLRAAQGFESSDFFVAGYWIWNKILQNLAVLGYGPNNMISASYDWRLAYLDLEKRDLYFSKLKLQIELTNRHTKQKSILVGHSMGSQVIHYFMKWVEAKGEFYGNGGPTWCNDNLAAVVDISGSTLGAPKSIPALLSGEMKDTVQMNQLAIYGLEKFFSKRERVELARTFGGIPSMFPKGGDVIWGNKTHAPDDPVNTLITNNTDVEIEGTKSESFGSFVRFRSKKNKENDCDFSLADSIDFILENSPDWFSNRVREQYSFGIAQTKAELAKNNHDHLKWSNPLEAALPYAPDMKYFCFYGVGNPTERAYTYTDADEGSEVPMSIDLESKNPVFVGDGDGTVSLLTHAMCHEWQKEGSRFNPANINVTVVEIKHEPDRFDIRGGAKTAEHVDILGSAELNELILKVVADQGHTIENRYVSELHDIVKGLDI